MGSVKLTAQDFSDINVWIRICKRLPGTYDASSRVHQRPVHVKEAVIDISNQRRSEMRTYIAFASRLAVCMKI